MYGRVAARANCLVVDRADIHFTVTEACRGMSKPGEGRTPTCEAACPLPQGCLGGHSPTARQKDCRLRRQRLSRMQDVPASRPAGGGLLIVGGATREVVEFDSSHCGDFER